MPFFIAKLVQTDVDAWQKNIGAHSDFLKSLLSKGVLRAGGALQGATAHSGLLILSAASRDDVMAYLADDPFTLHNVNASVTVEQWDPTFGILHDESSAA